MAYYDHVDSRLARSLLQADPNRHRTAADTHPPVLQELRLALLPSCYFELVGVSEPFRGTWPEQLHTSYTPYLIQCTLTHIVKHYQSILSSGCTRWVQFTSLIPSSCTVLTGHTSFTLEVFRACPSPAAADETDEFALSAAESTGTAAAACSTALR